MPAPSVLNPATGQWCHGPTITAPTTGSTIDTQARTAITAILAALRNASIISGATQPTNGFRWNTATHEVVLGTAIAAPAGGTTTDTQARTAIGAIITVLQRVGIIAGGTRGPQFVLDGGTHQWAAAAIPDITGGTTTDAESRTALNSALAAMRSAELIA